MGQAVIGLRHGAPSQMAALNERVIHDRAEENRQVVNLK